MLRIYSANKCPGGGVHCWLRGARISLQWKNMSITIPFIILISFWVLFVCGRFVTMTLTEVVTHVLKEVQRDVGVAWVAGGNEKEWPLI